MIRENKRKRMAGFTLVELLITMVVSGLIMTGVYSAYVAQQRTATAQEQVTEMQQNIRAAMMILSSDLRMAGFDPTKKAKAEFVDSTGTSFSNGASPETLTAVASSAAQIAFTTDLDEDGSIDEQVEDVNGDGNKDMSEMEQVAYRLNGTNLQRYSTTTGIITWQTIAENIEAIEFSYLDEDGTVTADFDEVVAVDVSILAKAANPDPKFTNGTTYIPASGIATSTPWDLNGPAVTGTANPPNDNFRRRLLITRIQCRNLGL
jgi:type IV pilus assembly protein PilW